MNPSKPGPEGPLDARTDIRVLLLLWLVPLVVYVGLIGRWSLSGDEFYTYVDSGIPISELLSYEQKPLYYLICHALLKLNLNWPIEIIVRLPAAIAGSLIAPTFYLLLPKQRYSSVALLTAIISLANPWIFEMSQMARFYTLALWFATISAIAAYRWFLSPGNRFWLVTFLVSGALAAASHTPAVIVLPSGIMAIILGMLRSQPRELLAFVKRYGKPILVCGGVFGLAAAYFLWNAFTFWLNSPAGEFGNYSVPQILVALALFGGISGWAMACFPLLRLPTSWNGEDVFLVVMLAMGTIPFLFLVPLGGGVASKYLLFGLPCMFVLAARHWDYIDQRLPSLGYRIGLGVAILAFNLPYLASVASDGDHYEYRGIAEQLEQMQIQNPVVMASSNQMFDMYYQPDAVIHEMGTFENGVPRSLILEQIDAAVSQQRPLVLISREDRTELSPDDQNWLFSRFALVRTIQSKRFDHRRFRMSIYQYRPAGVDDSSCDGLTTHENAALVPVGSGVEQDSP